MSEVLQEFIQWFLVGAGMGTGIGILISGLNE